MITCQGGHQARYDVLLAARDRYIHESGAGIQLPVRPGAEKSNPDGESHDLSFHSCSNDRTRLLTAADRSRISARCALSNTPSLGVECQPLLQRV